MISQPKSINEADNVTINCDELRLEETLASSMSAQRESQLSRRDKRLKTQRWQRYICFNRAVQSVEDNGEPCMAHDYAYALVVGKG
jgi:hypothetical protein